MDRTLFRSDLVTIGAFRAPASHPRFKDSGPIEAHIFVFPRTAVELQYDGAEAFVADPCTVTFYNRGQTYTRDVVDPRGDLCEWFAVRPDVLREALIQFDPGAEEREDGPFSRSHGLTDATTYAIQRLIVEHTERAHEPSPLAIDEGVMTLLTRVLHLACGAEAGGRVKSSPERSARTLVFDARRFLQENFKRPIKLDDIARAVGTSVFHLCRVFKAGSGTTLHRYRNQLRLRCSLELVAERDSDISRVAFSLGFSSHSHFTAAFRAAFALTPSQFRREAGSRAIVELSRRLVRLDRSRL